MRVQLASDLHLELLANRWPDVRLIVPAPEADLLVLAGDIGNGTSALQIFAGWPVQVVYLAGNHEYYNYVLPEMREKIRSECQKLGIVFLDNDAVTFGDVRMLGSTLWTDYCLPRLNRTRSQLLAEAAGRIRDHFTIHMGGGLFTPEDALVLHNDACGWLKSELAKPWTGKTVVVTHHGCHPLSVHHRFIGDPLNAAFVSDLSALMPSVDLWLHGHVHNSFDYKVGRCRVVTNPAGYVKNCSQAGGPPDFKFENPEWKSEFVVDV